MSWFTDTFSSSIGRKLLVSLTGLFLISFLVVHLIGNLQLLKDDGGQAFNTYAYFMTHNPLIKTVSYLLYASILLHAFVALALANKNRKARPVGYSVNKASANSHWTSRSMALLGTLVLAFIFIHMKDFWFEYKFQDGIPMTSYTIDGFTKEYKNLFFEVNEAFHNPAIVGLYVVAMLIIAFHLYHGFASAFQTLGLNHKKYTPAIKAIGVLFSIVVPAAFALIPLYIYLQ